MKGFIKFIAFVVIGAIILLWIIGRFSGNRSQEKTSTQMESTAAIPDEYRSLNSKEVANLMTEKSKKADSKVRFEIDPNDSSTLMIFRETNLKPEEIKDWEVYLYPCELDVSQLKSLGFNKVRLYTNRSKGVTDYELKLLR